MVRKVRDWGEGWKAGRAREMGRKKDVEVAIHEETTPIYSGTVHEIE